MVSVSDLAKGACRVGLALNMWSHLLQTKRMKEDPRHALAVVQAIRTWIDKGGTQWGIDLTWVVGGLHACLGLVEAKHFKNPEMKRDAIESAARNLILQVGSEYPKVGACLAAAALAAKQVVDLTEA